MTPEERALVDELFSRLAGLENTPGTRMPAQIFRGFLEDMRHVPNFREYLDVPQHAKSYARPGTDIREEATVTLEPFAACQHLIRRLLAVRGISNAAFGR
jgi:hypothetical protein